MLDDESCLLGAMEMILRIVLPDSEILTFDDAKAALQELERQDPDVFTTDWNHPGLNGGQLLQILANKGIKYPVVVISACAVSKSLDDFVGQGLNVTLLSKPFTLEGLRRVIAQALVPKPPSTVERASGGSLRIVLVDDEEMLPELCGDLLRWWFQDATILSFNNGAEALKELVRTEPDLLMTDDVMQVMDGLELCEHVLKRGATYPIILHSGYDFRQHKYPQWVREVRSRGLNVFFLQRPFSVESLQRVLEAAGFRIPPEADRKSIKTKQRVPRIILVNDELSVLQAAQSMIRICCEEAELLSFQTDAEAWEELSKTNPDLLMWIVSAPILEGKGTLERLLQRKVSYPIIVISAHDPDER